MDASLRSRWRALHRGAGALFGVVLFVVLFSGTWSLAADSMQGWWRPPPVAVARPSLPLDELVARAAALGVPLRDARIVLPQPDDPAIRFCDARQACTLALDPATGERLADGGRAALLVTLHKTLFAGFPGRIFVSLWGIVLLVLIVAGLIVHHRRWPDAARIRRGKGLRAALFDLHAWIGQWGSPWLVLFAFTGALSGLGALGTVSLAGVAYPGQPQRAFADLLGGPPPAAAGGAWQRAPDLDALLLRDAARMPDFRREAVVLHGWGDANARVEIAGTTAGLPSTAVFERHLYRAVDGQWLADVTSRGRGFWLRAFIAVQPLHFAQYGWVGAMGGVLRVVHFLMGLAACALCATGLHLWIERRRAQQDRSANVLAAVAVGTCGGLVLAGGVLLLAGRALPDGVRVDHVLAMLFWAVWGGAVALAAGVADRAAWLRRLMCVAGAAYALAGVTHCAIALLGAGAPVYWPIDAALVAFGALLLRAARRPRRDAMRCGPRACRLVSNLFNVMQLETSMRDLLEHRRLVITITLLYLSQGIPIGIAMDAMPTLLRHDGAPLHALAFLPLVGLPWVVKFLWAPVVDNRWSPRIGRRRSWMLPMQTLVVLCLGSLAQIGMTVATAGWAVGLLAVASLASATQDIANDGMAAEHFSGDTLAKINAIQIAGVMIGFFGGGAGTLTLIGLFGQRAAFLALAAVPLASLACVLWVLPRDADRARVQAEHNASLVRFAKRPRSWSLLSLALLSAMTAVSGFGLSKLFLNDSGWTLDAIGKLGMAGGIVTVVLGCGGGAWLVRRLGLWPAFTAGVSFAGAAALLWFAQASGWLPVSPSWAWLCTVLGSLATGITSVSIMTAGMRFAGGSDQAGTDVTAVQSTRDLGELIASSTILSLTAKVGYTGGFLAGAALAVCAVLIAMRLRRREAAQRGVVGDVLA